MARLHLRSSFSVPAAGNHRAEDPAGLAEELDDVVVAALQRRHLRRIAAAAGGAGVLRVVHADERRRIDLVRRHRNADAVRELDHPFLLQVRQAHVALDQIVLAAPWRAAVPSRSARGSKSRCPSCNRPLPFHQIAGAVDARAGTHAGVVRLAILDRLVRRVAGAAHRRDRRTPATRGPAPRRSPSAGASGTRSGPASRYRFDASTTCRARSG